MPLTEQQITSLTKLGKGGRIDPDRIAALAQNWPAETRAAMIEYLRTAQHRESIRRRYRDVVDLAVAIDPNYVVTPAIQLVGRAIETALTKPNHNLLINVGSQEFKSTLCAIYTPIRAFQLNPNNKIILATYAESLALDHSRKCRDIIRRHGSNVVDSMTGVQTEDKIGFQISDTNSKVDSWTISIGNGGFVAAGLHGSITGKGADCVSGDTCVLTEHGYVTAKTCYDEKHGKIWSYDHATGVAGWHRVEARRCIRRRRLVTVYTQAGAILRCTPDHRIYTRRGYVQARNLRSSDQIFSLSRPSGMSSMQDRIPDHVIRYPQSNKKQLKIVLRVGLLGGSVKRRSAWPGLASFVTNILLVLSERLSTADRRAKVLLKTMRIRRTKRSPTGSHPSSSPDLPNLRSRVSTDIISNFVLQPEVRGCRPLETDDWHREFALQNRYQLCEIFPLNAPVNFGTRSTLLCGMRHCPTSDCLYTEERSCSEIGTNCAPHQRRSRKQFTGKSDIVVQDMPCDSPQILFDTVSAVIRDSPGTYSVYDFQVEGARNFFADGLLVHNCFIIDDPYKSMEEADSVVGRNRVSEWMHSVARTRLSPRASTILILTRWHPLDVAGEIIEKEALLDPRFRTWRHINIPAISEEGIPDALNRPPGVVMESAVGRTREDYDAIRRDVGERVWYAVFQGKPQPPGGGYFSRDWFTPHMEVPEHPVAAIVGLDPAETGKKENDETGIIGGYLCPNGKILLAEDWSGRYTSDQWARKAVLLALTIEAREIAIEAYTTFNTYKTMLKRAWRDIHDEAVAKFESGEELTVVERRALLGSYQDAKQARPGVRVSREMTDHQMPFIIFGWRGGANADAVARSGLLRQALETGKARTVEYRLAVFEDQACGWLEGQHQPDRIAAGVITHDRLLALGTGRITAATPLTGKPSEPAPLWLRRRLRTGS
jgi:hypothetical protein